MQWLHSIFDQAKFCILELAVLVLYCIGIYRILQKEAGILNVTPRNNQQRGVPDAPLVKPTPTQSRNGRNNKENGTKAGAPPRQRETVRKA